MIGFLDLFSGIGGFHLGFTQAGFTSLKAIEINKQCVNTFNRNFNINSFGDVSKFNILTIKKPDLILAGFPCQPFSSAGKKLGFEDTRGTLFFDICRIAHEGHVKTIVLENVKQLLYHDQGKTLSKIIQTLIYLGYHVSYQLLNAKDFMVPQNRERIIIVADRYKLFTFSNLINNPTNSDISIKDFLDDPELVPASLYLQPDEYTIIDAVKKQPNSGLIFTGYRNKNIRKVGVKENSLHLSRTHKQPNRIYSILGNHPTLSSQESSGRYLIYCPDTKRVRTLTIRECYRIMGFPEDFIIHPTKTEAYRQIGNSVCIPMIHSIAKEIKKQLF